MPLELEPGEREVLAAEAVAFARALTDPAAQERYARVAAAAADGSVPDDLLPAVETMLELVFERGRPSNRAVLQAVFGKTPRGRTRQSAAHEVNQALRTLRGQSLENLRLVAGPAGHTLVIETDRCRLTVELDAGGARVASLETG